MDKKKATKHQEEIKEEEYSQKTDIEHIWDLPDMVLSSDELCPRIVYGYDFDLGRVVTMKTDIPPAMVQLSVEAIINAADHVDRSRQKGYPERAEGLPCVEVDMDFQRITVKNYGIAVPIDIHKKYGVPTPQFLFGNLRSSSNYQQGVKRTGVGRNGYGIKTVGIFSDPYEIEIVNIKAGKRYRQSWSDKLQTCNPPIITEIDPKNDKESSVTISYIPRFDRFKMDPDVGYPVEFFSMVAFLVLSISFSHKVPTRFNSHVFNNTHIIDMGSMLYSREAMATSLVHYQLDDNTERVSVVEGRPTPILKKGIASHVIVPVVEILMIDSSLVEDYSIISFVNGMLTEDGGVHVDSFLKQVVTRIVKHVNSGATKKTSEKTAKTSKTSETKKTVASERSIKITAKDVKPSIVALVSVRVDDPKFDGQIKNRLKFPVPSINFTDEELTPIHKWGYMDQLEAIVKGLELHALAKTDGKKVPFVKMDSGFAANKAGTKDSNKCTIIFAEGKSAMGYVIDYISQLEKGRDYYGVYPLRGKLLNTRKASAGRILKNREIADIKRIIGIKEGYNDIGDLRYGKVMIMTDADPDGSHITALICNLFDHLYTNLLEQGYVVNYRTKYLRAVSGRKKQDFYTEQEFEEWKKITPNWRKWEYFYFKGLGTSETKDVIEDAANPKIIQMTRDEEDGRNFVTLFGKSGSHERKRWLEIVRQFRNQPYILTNQMSFTTFFNREFSAFAIMSLERAIPRASDSLKHSHRQIIWGVMNIWKGNTSGSPMKVAQMAAEISKMVSYKHGEMALSDAIIHMATDFMGSNNLNLLLPMGQFGTRFMGGADAASARYVFTKPSQYFRLVFRREDIPIMERVNDEGKELEPIDLFPIIPIGIVNGASGIALGYSTSFPNYNPRDIVDYLLWWLKKNYKLGRVNQKTPEIIPSYVKFKGEVVLIKDAPYDDTSDMFMGEGVEDLAFNDDDYDDDKDTPDDLFGLPQDIVDKSIKYDAVELIGTYEEDQNGNIRVTELPPGKWTINYYRLMEKLKSKKEIRDFQDHSTKTSVNFTIKGFNKPDHRRLNLVKRFPLSNLVLLDQDCIPKRYHRIQDYLNEFATLRHSVYEKRRVNHIAHLIEIENKQRERIKFIDAVIKDRIVIRHRPTKDILKDMEELEINPALFEQVRLKEISPEGLAKNEEELRIILNEREQYEKLTAAEIWKMELLELSNALKKDSNLDRQHEIEIRYSQQKQRNIQKEITNP